MSRVFLFLLIALCAGAGAQERAGDKLVIGQSVELSGQAVSKENLQGALAYFQMVNSQGGVHGRPIELKSYDDKRDPAVEAVREFDLGGATVNYSPGSHQGSKFVEMVVVGKNGVFWR